MAIPLGNYNLGVLTPSQREELWHAYGKQGDVPPGWNGEGDIKYASVGGPPIIDPIEQARKFQQFQIEANQPIVQSLQGQIPTTQAAYAQKGQALESQKGNLEQRYQSVLQSLSASENKETQSAQLASAREFGKRGVPLSSGAYDQYLAGQVNPVSEYYAAQKAGQGANFADLQSQLGNLIAQNPIQQQQAIDQINQAIAQLKAGNPGESVQSALQQVQLMQQAQQAAAANALRERELTLAAQPRSSGGGDQYATLGEGQTLYDLLSRQAIYTAPKTYKSGGGGVGNLPDLSSIFG